MTASPCQFCTRPLEPAQEFRFLVETETLAEPAHLNRIRRLPATQDGKPLRVCKGCQDQIEMNAVRFRREVERAHGRKHLRMGLMTAFGVLSAGWFLSVVLGAPRA